MESKQPQSHNFFKRSSLFFLSILIPILIMGISYYWMGIYIGSERTVMASDAFHQLSNFYASYNNALHGDQSIFYTWYGSLGLNFWALSAYYVNGLFTFLVYFFDNSRMPDAMYIITLLKFGAMGGSFYIFANRTFKLPSILVLLLSSSYALIGFSVAYSPMMMWLDGMVYLSLVILGIHRLMDKRKPILLFVSYLLLFVSNFYMAFMIGVFSFLYYWARFSTDAKQYKKSILPYFVTSFLAGGASMVVILPTILDLRNNGEALTEIKQLLTPDVGPWDLIVKSMVGVYDTAKFGSAPFLYIGIFPLIFFLFYFLSNAIPKRRKFAYGSLILFIIASVYIQPLNLFWHGFHAPNMLLFRFSFLYSFLALVLAGYGLEKLEKKEVDKIVNIVIGLLSIFLLAYFFSNKKKYDYLTSEQLLWTVLFLAIYLVIIVLLFKKFPQKKGILFGLCVLLVIFEIGLNTQAMMKGIQADWTYPSREAYTKNYDTIQTLVDQTKGENNSFSRVANLDRMTINESFNVGYSGVSMFSSIRNRHSSMYMNSLGFRSEGTNLVIEYDNNTLIMDSLLGIRYNLAKKDPMKFGYKQVAKKKDYQLYENRLSLPLSILTDKGIYKEEAVKNQTELLDYLSKEKRSFVSFTEPKQVNTENVQIEQEGDFVYYSDVTPGKEKILQYTVSVPANTQEYLSLFAEDTAMMSDVKAEVTVNGITRTHEMKKVGQYYNLGHYDQPTVIPVKVVYRGNSLLRILRPDVLLLDTVAFEQSVQAIQKKGIDWQVKGRKASTEVELSNAQVLLTTIPFDKGWRATIDGKPLKVESFKEAFIALNLPKGKHTLQLIFLPEGFTIGAVLFVSCILLFIFYIYFTDKHHRKIVRKNEEE